MGTVAALTLVLGATVSIAGPADAQQESLTVGGSGQPSVEVNLGALEPVASAGMATPELRAPAVSSNGEAPIVLTPPAGALTLTPIAPITTPVAPPPPELPPPEPVAPTADSFVLERPEGTTTTPDIGVTEVVEVPEFPAPQPEPEPAPTSSATLPEPAPAPVIEEPPAEVAALTPAAEPLAEGQVLRVAFAPQQEDLPVDVSGALNTLAGRLLSDDSTRLQLRAYAGGTTEQASQARRSVPDPGTLGTLLLDRAGRAQYANRRSRAGGCPTTADPPTGSIFF